MPWDELVRTLGSGGTLIAVLIAAQQLLLNRRQIRASFEDDLSREYRSISRELPADASFVDPDLSQPLTEDQMKAMFRYFDLSNEQLRYSKTHRISRETADAWRDGISDNLTLPRFEQAWAAILPRVGPNYFTELNNLPQISARRVPRVVDAGAALPSVAAPNSAPSEQRAGQTREPSA